MSEFVLKRLKDRFPDAIVDTYTYRGDDTAVIARDELPGVCLFLRDDPELKFEMLIDLTGVDYGSYSPELASKTERGGGRKTAGMICKAPPEACPDWRERFEVVYHLKSYSKKHRVRLKVPVPESDPVVPSVVGAWKAANWLERECFDMFGVRFADHPNLTRILMYDEFEGHPLRKDYPVHKQQPRKGPVR